MRNLPVAGAPTGLVATPAHTALTAKPIHAPAPPAPNPISITAHLRAARARAEAILREHPLHEGPSGSSCQSCLLAYPCDAVQAAQDVIAITTKLQPGRLGSSRALVEFMADLVELRATDTDRHTQH